ncbi:PstS family phosphate ABC transporter substrate-binding protein [Fusibacter bizertensis]
MKNLKIFGMLMLVLTMVFTATACGATKEETTEATTVATTAQAETQATTEAMAKLEGQVIVDGSGTVYPLMAHIAEEYMTSVQPNVSVQVGRAGSSAGFKKFIPGETDLSDASRKIKDEEVTQLADKGLKMDENVMEIQLAYDGLTIVINKDNTWATEMTKDEIINMFLSGKYKENDVVLWSDIRPEWPAEEITFYGPNENHGTYEFFAETILAKEPMVTTANLQQEYSTLVDLVSKDKNAIAYFGYGYYESNKDKLTAVKVDFGNGPVAPELATIGSDLAYAPFTRLVYTYLNLNYAKEKPQVLDFAKYIVSSEGAKRLASENGFAPLPDSIYKGYQDKLDALK